MREEMLSSRMFELARGMVLGCSFALMLGCASKVAAPVETRGGKQAGAVVQVAAEAPVVARPGHYIVRKGDTLYSIAHQHERDYRELATWNGLDDVNVIKVGQELRVVPPESAAGSKPIDPSPVIETRPLDSAAGTASSTAVSSSSPQGSIKSEPKGGRMAYSPQAWKDLQASGKQTPASVASSAPASMKPASAGEGIPAQAGEVKTSQSGVQEDGNVTWVWPGSGKVIGSFNDASNKGVDIGGNVGDPVVAAGAGRVVYVGSGVRGYGNLVIIKHNSSFISAYAHNSEVFVKEGQSVQKGQKIAALGSSDAERAKLHFEIRRQGRPVDPLKYLPSR